VGKAVKPVTAVVAEGLDAIYDADISAQVAARRRARDAHAQIELPGPALMFVV
jgi:hypothetical protein